jgi:hypothetical protein
MNPFDSVTALEDATPLDRVSGPVREAEQRLLGNGVVRDGLHGVWLGHPLHPVLVQVPLGAFMSAAILDLLPGEGNAADTLIATGILATPAAAASGLADWSQMHQQQQRVGVVHAAANTVATVLYGASLVARRRGHRGAGKAWAMAGLGVLSFSGFLGGHLAFRQAGGANHAEAVPHLVPPGWHDLCALDDLAGDGEPQLKELNRVPLLRTLARGQRVLRRLVHHLPVARQHVQPRGRLGPQRSRDVPTARFRRARAERPGRGAAARSGRLTLLSECRGPSGAPRSDRWTGAHGLSECRGPSGAPRSDRWTGQTVCIGVPRSASLVRCAVRFSSNRDAAWSSFASVSASS